LRGEGAEVTLALCAKTILHNGLGQYAEALDACATLADFDEVGYYGYVLVETVEAASRCGQMQIAREAADRIAELAAASRTATGLGLAVRCAALANETDDAEAEYQSAISHLGNGYVVYLARTHLVYGEWYAVGAEDQTRGHSYVPPMTCFPVSAPTDSPISAEPAWDRHGLNY